MNHSIEKRLLSRTNIEVSRLCLGTLTIGPLQANLPIQDGAYLIRKAVVRGVKLPRYSTAIWYIHMFVGNLRHGREDIVIASRSYDYTYDGMQKAVALALESMGMGT